MTTDAPTDVPDQYELSRQLDVVGRVVRDAGNVVRDLPSGVCDATLAAKVSHLEQLRTRDGLIAECEATLADLRDKRAETLSSLNQLGGRG